MISHIRVYNAVSKFLESQGYVVSPNMGFRSPFNATHPTLGEIEIYFYGENYRWDESMSPFPMHKWTRSDIKQAWQVERTMMNEEDGHVCVAKALLMALTKATQGKRIGLAFPDNHNIMQHLNPVGSLFSRVIEFFFVCTDLSVAAVGSYWDQLPSAPPRDNTQVDSAPDRVLQT